MAVISTILAAWLGSMFVYSAGLKIARYDHARGFLRPYAILPPRLASAAGILLPWVELATGILLLFGLPSPVGPLLGTALGASFAYGSFQVLRRRADVPCGCTGATDDRVNRTTLLRALVIALSGLFILVNGATRPPVSVVVPLVLLSLVPAGVGVYRRTRATQQHQRHAQRLQEELIRLRRVLAAPPAAPALNGFAYGDANSVSSEREEAAQLKSAL
ncbi:MAG TPA: MauE/DoxX family redox-associated membrane protein [Chloroflexota bacterium]|jgi:hypothetical protein|nr:MauE/DoxX family redox-associated membrane protein [Chloroflexota bacterium]